MTLTVPAPTEVRVHLRRPHALQYAVVLSAAKRKIIRAGRRSGKTVGMAILSVQAFLSGRRVLYATPTQDQLVKYWWEVKRALVEPIDAGLFEKNETLHTIQRPGTEQRIRAKTAWNADTMRGDYADLLILDEWQLMDEDAWETVGAPMLLDNDGDAVFVYTPPSLHSRSLSKARDPRHAAKMYERAEADMSGRWAAFHATSRDNPYISATAVAEITRDMTALAIRQEIEAEDLDEVPGALWTRSLLEATRVPAAPALTRVVVGVDPPGGRTECGIVVAGIAASGHRYVLADYSLYATPERWAEAVLDAYQDHGADRVVGEANYGGDMVEATVRAAAHARGVSAPYRAVRATRGKAVRAEPQVAGYERGEVHHAGTMVALEEELVTWVPGETAASPNRLDALVWALTELAQPRGGRVTVL